MNSRLNIVLRVIAQGKGEIKAMEQALQRLQRSNMGVGAGLGKNSQLGRGMWSGMMMGAEAAFNKMERFGKNLQWTGRQVEFRFTLPLVAAGIAATKFALDNDRAATKVRKVYGDLSTPISTVNSDMKQLRREAEALSEIFGVQQSTVLEVQAAWAAAGLTSAALGRATRNTLQVMVLGDMEWEDATRSLIAVQQGFQLNTKETAKALDALNVVENETAATLPDLIEGFVRSGATARATGVDYKHLAAALAVLTPAVGTGAQAGNAFKTILSRLVAPTKQAVDVLHELGIEVDSTSWKQKNGVQRLEELAKAYVKLTPAQQAFASSQIGTRFQVSRFSQVMADMQNPLGIYQTMLRKTANDQKNLETSNREIGITLASNAKAFDILKVKLQNALARAIVPMLPAILKLVDLFVALVDKFTALSPATQQMILGFAALLAITGPLFAYLGTTMTLIGRLGAGFTWVGVRVLKVATMLGLFGSEAKRNLVESRMAQEQAVAANEQVAVSSEVAASLSSEAWMKEAAAKQAAFLKWEKSFTAAHADAVASSEAAAAASAGMWEAAAAQMAARTTAEWTAATQTWIALSQEWATEAMALAGQVGSSMTGAAAETAAAFDAAAASMTAPFAAAEAASTAAAGSIFETWFAALNGIAQAAARAAGEYAFYFEEAAQLVATTTGGAAQVVVSTWTQVSAYLVNLFAGLPINWGTQLQLMAGQSAAWAAEEAAFFAGAINVIINMLAGLPLNWGRALQLMQETTVASAVTTVNVIESTGIAWVGTVAMMVQVWEEGAAGIVSIWQGTNAAITAAEAETASTWIATTSEIVGVSTQAARVTSTEWFVATQTIGQYLRELPILAAPSFAAVAAESEAAAATSAAPWAAVPAAASAGATGAMGPLRSLWMMVNGLFLGLPGMIISAFGSIAAGIGAAFAAIPAIITSPIFLAFAAIVAAVVALVVVFRKQFSGVFDFLRKVFEPFLPFLSAVFSPIVKLFQNVWYALPAIVRDSLVAVLRIVKQAALAVYDWLSYLNPFATHSPSLVSQVVAGVDLIARKYASLNGIGDTLRKAIGALKEFRQAAAMQGFDPQQQQLAEGRVNVAQGAPGALPAYDKLAAVLPGLRADLERVGNEFSKQEQITGLLSVALDEANRKYNEANGLLQVLQGRADKANEALGAAKDRLSELGNTPILGMKKFDDQIFAVTMREKALRLELLKLEDAGKSIDDVANRMADLNGEIEMAQGRKLELQLAGGGSDILGPLTDRINELQGMRSGLSGSVDAITKIQNELDALQRKAEMLDLEKALKFDPLTKQIDELINGVKEMPFDQLLAKTKAQKAEVAKLTAAYDQADAAVRQQKTHVDELGSGRDAIQRIYDVEKAKLDELGSAYDGIEGQINDITSALGDMASAAKQAVDAANKAGAAAGGSGMPTGGASFELPPGGLPGEKGGGLKAQADAWVKEAKKSFGSLNPFQPIVDAAGNIWDSVLSFFKNGWNDVEAWWTGTVLPQWERGVAEFKKNFNLGDGFNLDNISKVFDKGMSNIQGSMNKSGLGEFWTGITDTIKQQATTLSVVFNGIVDNAGAVWDFIVKEVQQAIDILGPELSKWGDLAEPALEAFKRIADGVGRMLTIIAAVVKAGLVVVVATRMLVWPALKNVVEALWEFIVRITRAALRVLRGVIEVVLGIVTLDFDLFAQGVEDIFGGLWDGIIATVEGAWNILRGLFVGLLDGMISVLNHLRDAVPGPLKGVVDVLIAGFSYARDLVAIVFDTISGVVEGVMTTIHGIIEIVLGLITLDWDRAWNGMKESFSGLWRIVYSLVDGAISAVWNTIRLTLNLIKAAWTIAWEGVKLTLQVAWNFIQAVVRGSVGIVVGLVEWVRDRILAAWNFWADVIRVIRTAWNTIPTLVAQGVGAVLQWIGSLPDKIKSFLANSITWLYNAGKNILQGLWNGLKDKAGDLFSWVENTVSDLVDKFTHPWDMLSPSKVTRHIGAMIMEGMKLGLEQGAPAVSKTIEKVGKDGVKQFDTTWQTHSPSLVTWRLGKDIMKGLEHGIKDNSPAVAKVIAFASKDFLGEMNKIGANGQAAGARPGSNFARQMINGFLPPKNWGKEGSDKWKEGVVDLQKEIDASIKVMIPDINDALSNLGSDADPVAFQAALQGKVDVVTRYASNLKSIVSSQNPLLAAKIAELGPEAGAALAQKFVEAGPGVQASAQDMIGRAVTAVDAAREQIKNMLPAFGMLGGVAATALVTRYGGNIDLATITNGAVQLAAAAITMNPHLPNAGATLGKNLSREYEHAANIAAISDTQLANAKAIFDADQKLPKSLRTLGTNSKDAFNAALVLAGVSTDQIKKVGDNFEGDRTSEGKSSNWANRMRRSIESSLQHIDVSAVNGAGEKMASQWDIGFRNRMGIHSPSTVMLAHGRDLVAGLRNGVDSLAPAAVSAIDRMTEAMRKAAARTGPVLHEAWKSIRPAFAGPINWVIGNAINPFVGGLNSVAGSLGKGAIAHGIAHVPEAHSGGVIGSDPLKSRPAIAKNDEQLTMMQKGEGVIPRAAMANISDRDFEMIRQGNMATMRKRGTDSVQSALIPAELARVPETGDGDWWGATVKAITDPMMAAVDAGIKRIPEVKAMIHGAVDLMHKTAGQWGPRGNIAVGGAEQLALMSQRWLDEGKVQLDKKKETMGGDLAAWRGKAGSYNALIKYLSGKGVPFRVTSTTNHSKYANSGNISLHYLGRAVDFAGSPPDSQGLANIFNAFKPVEGILAELIYSGPQVGYNIKNGARVAKYAVADHHDHVHAALAAGGLVRATQGGTLARLGEGRYDEAVLPLPRGASDFTAALAGPRDATPAVTSKSYDFRGSHFSFPNVKDGDDAEAFLRNLENQVDD